MAVTIKGNQSLIIQVQSLNTSTVWATSPAASPIFDQYGNIIGYNYTSVGWQDSPLSLSITPTYSTSKIFVGITFKGGFGDTGGFEGTSGGDAYWRLLRNGGLILQGIDGYTWQSAAQISGYASGSQDMFFMDSPGSTATQTYTLQGNAGGQGPALRFNSRGIRAEFRVSSQMLLMEIASE